MLRSVTALRSAGLASLATAAFALLLLSPPAARACGGFFCSQAPIDQQGEQILFSVEPGRIQATVQITYAGEAHDFAWVIPVSSKPVVSVTPTAVFTRLRAATEPRFLLDWGGDNQCGLWWYYPQAAADGGTTGGGKDAVTVLETAEVGPYETATVQSDDPRALFAWLATHGYDQPPSALPYIEHYVSQGMLFVALKLKASADVGDLQPVTFTFTEGDPCVPLILTQVAASPDMPVRIFVLGEARAVPTNWLHVAINEKKIDWLSASYGFGSGNYTDVVTAAVDEAAGRAFVTEYAGSSQPLAGALWSEGQFDMDALATRADPESFLQGMLEQGLPRDGQVQSLIKTWIPKPGDADLPEGCRTDANFYAMGNIATCLQYMPSGWSFSPQGFASALDDLVVTPLRETQAVIDRLPYLTRLFTTVSPDEMTRDPIFAFNPDLPEVSNLHTATATATCSQDGQPEQIQITLESGESFSVSLPEDFTGGGLSPDQLPAGPFASRIELVGQSGPPTPVAARSAAAMDRRLDRESPESVLLSPGAITPQGVDGGPSGCQGSPSPLLAALAALAALLWLGALARRRSRSR